MGPKKARSRSNSPAPQSDKVIDMLIQIQQSINTNNNTQQATLNSLMQKLDGVQQQHYSLKEEVSGHGGIKSQLTELQEYCGNQEDRLKQLEDENKALKKELTIVKNILIHTNHKVDNNESQIVDLKARSMNQNILIHDIVETPSENLSAKISELFDEKLGVSNVRFANIHRMGKPVEKKPSNDTSANDAGASASAAKLPRPRIIVARLTNPDTRQSILTKASQLGSDLDFRVTGQYPEEMRDARTRLWHVKEQYDSKKVPCEIKGSKLVLKKSGSVYHEKVSLPSAELLLTAADPDVQKKLENIPVFEGDVFRDRGNYIASFASQISSYKDVSNFSLKVLSSDKAVPANSNVLVYHFKDSEGTDHEGWSNDREFGAGLDILKYTKTQGCENFAVILSRKVGEHLGYKRHQIFQANAYSAVVQTQ